MNKNTIIRVSIEIILIISIIGVIYSINNKQIKTEECIQSVDKHSICEIQNIENTEKKYLNNSHYHGSLMCYQDSINISDASTIDESIKGLKAYFSNDELLEDFFTKNDTIKSFNEGIFYTACKSNSNNNYIFIIYKKDADQENNNNKIIIHSKQKTFTQYKTNHSSGDMGVCSVDGYIEDNFIYSCNRGDGPKSYTNVYTINVKDGVSKTIKKCSSAYDYKNDQAKEVCEVNLLN
jgi:hypothetical protein